MQDINKLQEEIDSLNQSLEIIKKCKYSSVLSYTCLGLNMAIKELDSQIEKLKGKKPWKPAMGEQYCFYNGSEASWSRVTSTEEYCTDNNRINSFGAYKTEAECQFRIDRAILINQIDEWEKLNNPDGWDWNQEEVWGLDLNNINLKKELTITCYSEAIPNFGKLANSELAKKFLTEFGDRILKYLVNGV